MSDGRVPEDSVGRRAPRFSTYSFDAAEHGKLHWVCKDFDEPATVASCAVYWVDESSRNGSIRLPKIVAGPLPRRRREETCRPPSGQGGKRHQFNEVSFTPVATTAQRLEVQWLDQPRRYAMGIFE